MRSTFISHLHLQYYNHNVYERKNKIEREEEIEGKVKCKMPAPETGRRGWKRVKRASRRVRGKLLTLLAGNVHW